MTPNRVTEKSYPNSQTLKEGITMTFKQFGRRIGAMLAIGIALGLMIGVVPLLSFAQPPFVPGSPSVSLNPTQGATSPGGQTQFQISFQGATGPGWQPTWNCSFIFMPPRPNGIDIRFSPVTVIVPPGEQRTAQATVTVANFVAQAIYNLGVRVNCTAAALNGAPLLYQRDFVYTLQVGSGGGPNPPPPGGTGPCQFNFAFDPPVGNLVQVQNTQDPMAWAWEARMTILATAQGNCPATSQFTARLAPGTSLFPLNVGKMMQPQVVQGNIPGRSVTATISVRNSALDPGFATTAVIEICATQSVSQPWRCQNYNYQLRRGGGSTPPGPGLGQARVRLVATPNPARLGETIIFQLINEGPNTLQLPNPAPWRIVYQGQTFSPGAVAQVITNVAPGETRSWTWDQRTPMGNQAPAGDYTFIVTTLNGDPREPSVQFSIRDAGGPSPGLQAFIRTDRGCQETGENPIYSVGDSIVVQFRINGAVQVFVTLEDLLPDGRINVILQQWVPGNQLLQLTGQIVPPTGRETLRLTAQVGQQSVVSECSFMVQ
jgi:hypothetical protein